MLQAPVTTPAFSALRTALSFSMALPGPGTVTYRLEVVYRDGATTHRVALGSMTTVVAAQGRRRMTLSLGARNWRILRRHRQGQLVLKTSFTGSGNGLVLDVQRDVTPAGRPTA